jgi:hypothetical protein
LRQRRRMRLVHGCRRARTRRHRRGCGADAQADQARILLCAARADGACHPSGWTGFALVLSNVVISGAAARVWATLRSRCCAHERFGRHFPASRHAEPKSRIRMIITRARAVAGFRIIAAERRDGRKRPPSWLM